MLKNSVAVNLKVRADEEDLEKAVVSLLAVQRFRRSVFVGNNVSFSATYVVSNSPVCLSQQPIPKSKNAGKLSEKVLLGIVVGVSVVGALGCSFRSVACLLY
nr:probable inactive receptor kinase At4g23740 [Ipomoea trifida]